MGHSVCYPQADVLTDEEAARWMKIYSPADCERAYFNCEETPIQRALALRWGIDEGRIRAR